MATEYKLDYTASDVQKAINNALNPDASLSVKGKLADAKAVGDAIATCKKPTDEQVNTSIRAWLDEHPEATTTVVDGAITTEKLADGSITEDKLSPTIKIEVGDDSVTPNKTTFFKKTTKVYNLYDAVNAENNVTCMDCVNGTNTSAVMVYVYTCPAFPVTPGKSYFIGGANGTMGQYMVGIRSWAYFDKEMNFVPAPAPSAAGGWNPVPDGVAYMRVSTYYTVGNNRTMVVEGTKAPTTFVSYQDGITQDMGWKDEELRKAILDDAKEYMEENLSVDGAKITAQSIPITAHDSVIEYNLNLVNPAEIEVGKQINNANGTVIAYEYSDVTGFVPVKAGTKYYCSIFVNTVAFYDKDKKFVKDLGWSSAANLLGGFEVPTDGFVRVVFSTGKKFAVSDYGMNWEPAEYGTKKIVYADENGTIFPEAVNDAGVVPSFEWKKVNLADENKKIDGNATNGVFFLVAKDGNTKGFIIDVTPGTDYVFKGGNTSAKTITQYNESWEFVSETTVSEDKTLPYASFRYTPSEGVSHVIVNCHGFFAEESEAAIGILGTFNISHKDTATVSDGLAIKYAPTNMAEYVRQFAAKTILRDQSVLLQQTIHKTNGLKWNCLGDSLTTMSWGTNMYNIVSDALGLTPNNYGIVSSTIADYENNGASGDPMCVRYANMDADADIVTVMGGTNDYARDDKVGTMADRDKTTLYGACHVLFRGLIEKYPDAKIAVILPPQNGQGVPSYVETQGGDPDMANMRKKVGIIREVAEYYSLPVCDLFNHGGIPGILPSTIGRLLQGDYLHITTEGYKVLSRQLLPFMRNLIG